MELKEQKLFEPLRNYFKNRGYKVFTEVCNPVAGTCLIDVVCQNDNEVIAIEMKMSLSKTVIHQAYRTNLVADKTYVAIPTNPRKENYLRCQANGIGIIRVNSSVEILLEAKKNDIYEAFYLAERLKLYDEGVEAGLPNQKGIGVTYDLCEQINEYQKEHPKAGWKEIYKNIPNHYSSYKSMASSLYHWRGFTLK